MNTPKIRLLADRVLVEIIKKQVGQTASGIFLPNTSEEKSLQGEVLRVSKKITDCELEEDKVTVGEVIIFSMYAGTDISLNQKEYKILRITDVIGAVEN